MTDVGKRDRGLLRIDVDECKGCGLCIEACPPKVIGMSDRLNHYGYRTAVYAGAGCTGCGICFMACPEPGAITVLRAVVRKAGEIPMEAPTMNSGAEGAAQCASN
jgi:2-oxoglutarate ferredoxin oxidoreductase subunit delta